MVATGGKYYLICNYDKYDKLSNYRVDRITDIRILDEKRKPIHDVKSGGLDLPGHMAEHVYMFSGDSIRAVFKAKNYIIDQLVEWFGTEIGIKQTDSDECIASVCVNGEAFFYWTQQYGLYIEVLEPLDMRERIINAAREVAAKYE